MNPFLGEIIIFAGNFAPRDWALCNGQLLPIASNQALFSLLGTIYGGDGRTTFALPDMRGRFNVGMGTGPGLTPRRQGALGGQEEVELSYAEMPSHGHTINAVNELGTLKSPTDHLLADSAAFDTEFSSNAPNTTMNSSMVQNNGGGQHHTNEQPFTCLNYIIALQGVFPSRS